MSDSGAFFEAVRAGDLSAAEAFLRADSALAEARDEGGKSPLHHAASRGDLDTAALLLRHGAEVHGGSTGWEWRPLVHAAWEGHLDMVHLLIAHGADVTRAGGQPIHYAGQRGHREVCRILAEVGAIDDLIDPPDPETIAVFRAAYGYDAPALAEMLKEKPELANARDVDGRTPMHEAATNGDVESVRVLLRAGTDLDARDRRGETALDRAAAHRQTEVVRLLLGSGAACDIFTAVRCGDGERTVRFLNEEPLLLNTPDSLGRTPLRTALMFGEKSIVRLLLDRGAEDPDELGHRFLRGQTQRDLDMRGTLFQRLKLQGSTFHDANLRHSAFNNVNLSGAVFNNVNLSGASIEEACIDGLTIWGVDVRPLVEAELKRRRGERSGSG